MGKFKIQKSATVNQYADATNVIGGTGGLTTITGTQVQATAYVTGGTAGNNASLLRARGRSKFFVADTSNTIQDENIVFKRLRVETIVHWTIIKLFYVRMIAYFPP